MKTLYTAILALALTFSALAGDAKPVWLIKYFSVVTDDGVKGYPAGTMMVREGDKFRAGQDIISVPSSFFTDKLEWAVAIAKDDYARQQAIQLELARAEADAAKAKEAVKPIDNGPKVVFSTPQMTSNLGTSSLEMSKNLGAAGNGNTHSKMSRGFYINSDGSLGKRAGEK